MNGIDPLTDWAETKEQVGRFTETLRRRTEKLIDEMPGYFNFNSIFAKCAQEHLREALSHLLQTKKILADVDVLLTGVDPRLQAVDSDSEPIE